LAADDFGGSRAGHGLELQSAIGLPLQSIAELDGAAGSGIAQ
jgi:hypothetical protein